MSDAANPVGRWRSDADAKAWAFQLKGPDGRPLFRCERHLDNSFAKAKSEFLDGGGGNLWGLYNYWLERTLVKTRAKRVAGAIDSEGGASWEALN